MTVNRKITYRLYPNASQEALLQDMLGLHCRVYNTLLEEHKRRYDHGLPSYSFKLMCRDLTQWRSRCSLSEVNAQSLQVTAKRVSLAFAAFFRRLKAGEEPGYPRFKSASRHPGWGYKDHGDGWKLMGNRLRISGVGIIPIRGKGRFTGTPKTCEIIRKQGKWYASVTFEVEADQLARKAGTGAMAFDWGLKNLLTIAREDGTIETIDNPRFLRTKLDAIKKLQLAVSAEQARIKLRLGIPAEAKIPGQSYTCKLKRLYRQVSSLHHKIANQRHDFYHKLSAMLVATFGAIATEDLETKEMVKRPKKQQAEDGTFLPNGANQKSKLNRDIHDAAPAKLIQMITHKAEEAGVWFGLAETKIVKPTQRCHKCGTLVKKELSDRWHTCADGCFIHCDRDENAARTLLRWFHEGYFWLGTSHAAGLNRLQETPSIAA
jgi:putative transposase